MREILAELTNPLVLVFLDWDAVADGTRPFRVYCDTCIDGFGAALEQEQTDCSTKPIAYISRATLDSEGQWTPLDLEACSIVWALKRLRGYLWGTKFRVFSDHKALESIDKVGNHMPEFRDGSSSSPHSITPLNTENEARTGTPASCLARRSLPRNTTAIVRRVLPLLRMVAYTS